MDDERLEMADVAIYSAMRSYASEDGGVCLASLATFGRRARLRGPRAIRRSIRHLIDCGYVARQVHRNGKTVHYTIHHTPCVARTGSDETTCVARTGTPCVCILLAQSDDPWYPLWALLVTTGLRLGEATGLQWHDVDLDAATATVRRTMHHEKGKGMVVGPPKTSQSRRTVHLAHGVVKALGTLRAKQEEQCFGKGQPLADEHLMFCTADGGGLDPGYLRKAFRRCLGHAGLPMIRIHDLRHTAATYLLHNGTHIKVVQELLGHSSITLTLDTYSHVLPRLHEQVAGEMDRLFARDAG